MIFNTLRLLPMLLLLSIWGCQNVNYVEEKPILIPENQYPQSDEVIIVDNQQGTEIIVSDSTLPKETDEPMTDESGLIQYEDSVFSSQQYASIWDLISSNSSLALETDRRAVKKQIRHYQEYPDHLNQIKDNTAFFIGYVCQELFKRNMPMELALLPIVESNYNPHSFSTMRAAGVWQFIPQTADIFNLYRDEWIDERRDIIKSTEAALNYLETLYQKFDQDWLLALAAYNAGQGVVRSAIRENRSQGKPGNFWSLNLPLETQNYVPKLLALNAIVQQPAFYNYQVPHISASPAIMIAPLESSISLEVLADALSIELDDLLILNAHFLKESTPVGSHHLILPADQLTSLETIPPELLKELHLDESIYYQQKEQSKTNSIRYKVKKGDSLWSIARSHGVTVKQLQNWNNLSASSTIHPGQKLSIGAQGEKTKQSIYRVKSGDTLWSLAIKFNCSIAELKKWNDLSDNELSQNQKLIVMSY